MGKSKNTNKIATKEVKNFRQQLLDWYDQNARSLPWRATKNVTADPYHVWLSEIMLQQTTVGAVKPYFQKFLYLWPNIHDLANTKQEDVLKEWAGLGYYARARNLHACAQYISKKLNGQFPTTQAELKKLPGIGDYTSAAITAIAFNQPATVVDGNVERVMARYFAETEKLPHVKKALKQNAHIFFENYGERPGDLAQSFMDLGATICTPKTPKCLLCPINDNCQGHKQGIAETLPQKADKKPKPQKHGYVYWIEDSSGNILLERRPEKSMLGGMLGFPTSEWVDKTEQRKHLAEIDQGKITTHPNIHHSFTHFDLELSLIKAQKLSPQDNHVLLKKQNLDQAGFPTLFKKAWKIFLTS